MISTLIAIPYQFARLPLTVVDGLSDKLPETSRPRVTLDLVMGTSDKFVGELLRNHDLAQRGADRLERGNKLLAAARLEQQAETRREQARDMAANGHRQAAAQRTAAQKKIASGLQEADAAEAKGTREARTEAARTASVKKAAANKRAAARTATVEQAKARVDAAAAAKKAAAQRAAKSEFDDARTTKRAAAKTRADADRLGALTGAKKQQRRTG